MIEGVYDVAIDTPKTHKRATVKLKSAGTAITGLLRVGDLDDIVVEGTCEDKDFRFEGEGDFGSMGHVSYQATGTAWGNSLSIECQTSAGTVEVFGTRMAGSAGDFGGSSNYLYSGRWSDGY